MRVGITGLGLWTAAGEGADAALDLLESGASAFSEPAWAEPLKGRLCALAPSLPPERPATRLAQAVAMQALGDRELPSGAGLILATSTGDISGPWCEWHAATLGGEEGPEPPSRHGPAEHLRDLLGITGPVTTVSLACASGTAALGLGADWIRLGLAPAVLVIGVDALSPFIHAGFDGLGALSRVGARPFHAQRDGLTLGEGAAALLLEPSGRFLAEVRGWGLASDARHLTAPHREGLGASLGMERALAHAGVLPSQVKGVSVHGTGTVFNDAMEAKALHRVFAGAIPPVHGVKHALGHTLGAAGAVEAAIAVAAMQRGLLPPPPQSADPALGLPQERGAAEVVLSTSSAFGGANGAVVLTRPGWGPEPEERTLRAGVADEEVVEIPAGPVDLAALFPEGEARNPRADRYLNLGLAAVARLLSRHSVQEGTGVVISSPSGCRGVDLRYHARLQERGLALASRRDFSYTIPYSPAAEASIRWTLRGPLLGLVGPGASAREAASRLVESGHASQVLCLDLEVPGERSPGRAVCALVAKVESE